MRPPRVAILALFFAASLFLLCRSISSARRPTSATTAATPPKSHFRSFFSFTGPFTLFPPNAAISLADDNSTFFPARPAAFGPALAAKGLSGQLWIGSGFADDNLQDGEGQGEFGCSDVAGWDDGTAGLGIKTSGQSLSAHAKSSTAPGKSKAAKRDDVDKGPLVDRTLSLETEPEQADRPIDDGTDDYLHEGLHRTSKSLHESSSSGSSHADIQSIQETAEITGKVVLLRRGGCGFLEKVKWAQRRGAIAVIVGDNQKGGPLIQMFARGDTSNVTIPAVFTAHTTAQILSSLMQPGSFIEDIIDENGNAALKVQQFDKSRKGRKVKQQATVSTATPIPRLTAAPKSRNQAVKKQASPLNSKAPTETPRRSWFSRLFSWGSGPNSVSAKSRPPSSGRLDWVLVDEWSDEKDKMIKSGLEKASKDGGLPSSKPAPEDDFQIGIQDWRDPDLVGASSQKSKATPGSKTSAKSTDDIEAESPGTHSTVSSSQQAEKKGKDGNGPKGGSITPGSGEYTSEPVRGKQSATSAGQTDGDSHPQPGLISKIFGDDDGADFAEPEVRPDTLNPPVSPGSPPSDGGHEGLWVTITPTSSASPFFDTLLVLVISPLVTLSFVYALLILRARIRRRRWRAPKSVVEQLPVRTYHTVASTPSISPRVPSPTSSSPTTPLLQSSSSATRPRPRSRTTTGVPDAGDLLRVDAALQGSRPPSRPEHEKGTSSEWKKYMGRQVECVVCLEEYVDGVSRVMSLPCGHEFHAECMYVWLPTGVRWRANKEPEPRG